MIDWPELDLPPINLWSVWKVCKGKKMGIGKTKDYVTISKDEYCQLLEDSRFLNCLRSCGVDSWDWYDEACEMFHSEEDEEC